MYYYYFTDELYHHGVKGMKWGVRRKRAITRRRNIRKRNRKILKDRHTKYKDNRKRGLTRVKATQQAQKYVIEKYGKKAVKSADFQRKANRKKAIGAVIMAGNLGYKVIKTIKYLKPLMKENNINAQRQAAKKGGLNVVKGKPTPGFTGIIKGGIIAVNEIQKDAYKRKH